MATSSTADILLKIMLAKAVTDVFPDLYQWKNTYKEYIRLIHPDVCAHPNSHAAVTKLNQFKNDLEIGRKYSDEAGEITYNLQQYKIIGNPDLLQTSLRNYEKLTSFTDDASKHFRKYMPANGRLVAPNELVFDLPQRAVPLTHLGVLPHEHANWILSRMLEFAGWLGQVGYTHAGFNPDSIFVIPENHGLICTSFYHLTPTDAQLTTISGKYSAFYPPEIFATKKASLDIDSTLAKRTAIYLLGDTSGSGVKLLKTHNNAIINFLQKKHLDPFHCYQEYRELLKQHFDTKIFHILNV